jgi:propane monooxygenase reductase component
VGEKHHVRFEPVGIEIEVDSDQTILRAAAEQGVQLMHGCKEGQCASCKSFVLDGEDIELDSYSTFALPDFERDEGSTLLCRAHAFEDLVIELLNYDEEMIQSGLPLRRGTVEVVANEPVTHDMRHFVVKLIEPEEIKYFPGQYLDFQVPGHHATRSFSMANTPNREGLFEFVIRIYPGGLFSGHLADGIKVGDRLSVEGPFGAFRLRESSPADLLFLGGGAGLAPLLALLRSMAERGLDRKVSFYYGARTRRDLCFEEEIAKLADLVPGLTFVPALSEPTGDDGWDGETGLITDVVERREAGLATVDAYVCGPPPMVEAAIAMLTRLGRSEDHIFYDKFTTTGEPEGED